MTMKKKKAKTEAKVMMMEMKGLLALYWDLSLSAVKFFTKVSCIALQENTCDPALLFALCCQKYPLNIEVCINRWCNPLPHPPVYPYLTCRKSCRAVALLRAEQGPCEPSKDFLSKFREQMRARGSMREPEEARESQREPEREKSSQLGLQDCTTFATLLW